MSGNGNEGKGVIMMPIAAFVVAPFAVVPVVMVYLIIVMFVFWGHYQPKFADLLAISAGGIIIAYIEIFLFGIVAYRVMTRRGMTSLLSYVVVAFVCGLVPFELFPGGVLLRLLDGASIWSEWVPVLGLEIPCAFGGAAVGAMFWWVSRPDKYSWQQRPCPSHVADGEAI